MRIAFVSDAELVNSNYRTYMPMLELERRGHEIRFNKRGDARFRASDLVRSDVVHIHRYSDPEMAQMVAQLRTSRVGVLWDNDDDVTAIPKELPNYRKLGGASGNTATQMAIRRIVTSVDIVSTPSDVLASHFQGMGAKDVRVLENCLPSNRSLVSPRREGSPVIAWMAGLEHQLDYQALRLKPIFDRLLAEHADLRIVSIGLGLGLATPQYEHHPIVDFGELPRALSNATIGIAPLADIPWNRARSNIKLKEYGAAGLPWLASAVGPYRGLGEKEGGRLVAEDEWYDALDQLIRDERGRRKLAKRTAKWAKGQTIDQHVDKWLTAYKDAASHARSGA